MAQLSSIVIEVLHVEMAGLDTEVHCYPDGSYMILKPPEVIVQHAPEWDQAVTIWAANRRIQIYEQARLRDRQPADDGCCIRVQAPPDET